MNKYVAVDIGGTAVKYGIICPDGTITGKGSVPTEAAKGGNALMDKVCNVISALLDEYPAAGIGVSSAGIIDTGCGTVLLANDNLPGWQGMRIRAELERRFSLPVFVENDVNCVALGENWLGAGKDLHNFVCVALGTGVGGGIILNNRIYRGSNCRAAEIGCLRSLPALADCLEKRASTAALVKNISKEAGNFQIDGEYIFGQIRMGNKRFFQLLSDWALQVAGGLADIIYLLDPQAIVIGGGVSGSPDILIPVLQDALGSYMRTGFSCELRVARLGNSAGLFGAVVPFVISDSIV